MHARDELCGQPGLCGHLHGGRLYGGGGLHDHRRHPGLCAVCAQLYPAHHPDGQHLQPAADDRGRRRADFPIPGRGGGGRGGAQTAHRGFGHPGQHCVRPREVRLRGQRGPGHPGLLRHGEGRPEGGHCGPHRRRQDHHGQAAHALSRLEGRANHLGRPPHHRLLPHGPAQPVRHGASGRLAVQRHHFGEHPLRQAHRHRRGGGAGRQDGPGRPLYPHLARGLPDGAQ